MPAKGKRKNNPGKADRVNPPHKTRLPVTDHPQSLNSTNGGDVPPSIHEVSTPPSPTPTQQPMDTIPTQQPMDIDAEATQQQDPPRKTDALAVAGVLLRMLLDKGPSSSTLGAQAWAFHIHSMANLLGLPMAAICGPETEKHVALAEAFHEVRECHFREKYQPEPPKTRVSEIGTQTSDQFTTHLGSQTSAPPTIATPEVRQASSSQATPLQAAVRQKAPPTHPTSPKAPRMESKPKILGTSDTHNEDTRTLGLQILAQHQQDTQRPPRQTRAVVLHAAPSKYKPGLMRRWIEEDNDTQILGIRWLLREQRRVGKLASSLVIYLAHNIDITCGTLRMGRRRFRVSEYDWDRPSGGKGKGRG